jgi:hypothetical protein
MTQSAIGLMNEKNDSRLWQSQILEKPERVQDTIFLSRHVTATQGTTCRT